MTSRVVRLCSAGLLLVAQGLFAQAPANPPQDTPPPLPVNPGPVVNPSSPAPAPAQAAQAIVTPTLPRRGSQLAPDDELVSLKLPDADIDTVLSALEIYTGKIILRPSQLPTAQGGYNLKIAKPIPKSQAILYLETILAMNQIAVIPMGTDALKVVQLTNARIEAPELIFGSTLEMAPSSAIASKLFQLDFLRVQEFQQMLQTITNPNMGGAMPLLNANAVLITDSISNLQRIEMLLQQVDKPSAGGMATKFYQLRNGAKASDLVAKLRSILTGSIQQQIGAGTTYSADDRSNQIILITDPRQFRFFDELIDKLDVRADPNTRNEVIYLRHAKADEVATVLVNIIKGQNQVTQRSNSTRPNPAQPNAPLPNSPSNQPQQNVVSGSAGAPAPDGTTTSEFSTLVTVTNDERSNSIIVSGTVDDIRLLKELIDKLDIVLAQVRIDVIIAEVTLVDNNESGIDQLGLQVQGDKLVGFSLSNSSNSFNLAGPDGKGFATITRPGTTGPWDLAGVINLQTTTRKSNATILSRPSITTSHAKEANVFVGESRPVVTGSVFSGVGGGATSTTSQLQIGINLTVTPLIGVDGSVQLDIAQDVDEVGDTTVIDGNEVPIVLKRTTKSFVSVRSGEIVVLGGLQRSSQSKSRNRLGPIPIIGDILGSRQKRHQKTELIFFLQPFVLTNTPADNIDAMRRVNNLPQREDVRKHLDPNYQPPKPSVLDRILPR